MGHVLAWLTLVTGVGSLLTWLVMLTLSVFVRRIRWGFTGDYATVAGILITPIPALFLALLWYAIWLKYRAASKPRIQGARLVKWAVAAAVMQILLAVGLGIMAMVLLQMSGGLPHPD
jgi:hypothetical protein